MKALKFTAWDKKGNKLDLKHLLLDCNGKVIGYDAGAGTYTIKNIDLVLTINGNIKVGE